MEFDSSAKKERFAQRVTQLRLQKNVSARHVSRSILQSEGYIGKVENGVALCSMESFFQLCDYFGISESEFFDDRLKYPEQIREITELLTVLSQDELAAIKTIVEKLAISNQAPQLKKLKK